MPRYAPNPCRALHRRRRRRGASRPAATGGFTLVETLVVAIIAVVLGAIIAMVAGVRRSAEQPRCLGNLRQIALAFGQFALDHGDRYPDPQAKQTSWEHLLRSYVTSPDTFRCQRDNEVYPSLGSSYDWRDTGKPETTLAGKLRDSVTRSNAVLAFEALPDWHERTKINAAWVDGSAHVMDRETCLKDLVVPVQ
jgi:type II secretory pathway pseudopilin PulG